MPVAPAHNAGACKRFYRFLKQADQQEAHIAPTVIAFVFPILESSPTPWILLRQIAVNFSY
jgi:hypothetical protein